MRHKTEPVESADTTERLVVPTDIVVSDTNITNSFFDSGLLRLLLPCDARMKGNLLAREFVTQYKMPSW